MVHRRGPRREYAGEQLPLDALATVLANPRRRFVLRYLQVRDAAVTIEELADAIAAREAADEATADAHARGCIRASLHHVHLPKLAEVGLVHYDRESGQVVADPRGAAGTFEPFLPRDVRVPTDPE